MSTSVPDLQSGPSHPTSSPGGTEATLSGALKVALVLLGGAVMGLGATAVVLDRKIDPGAVAIGPWVTSVKVGTVSIDPYAQAIDEQAGVVALAAAEGIAFMASTDDTGTPLSAGCAYRIAGTQLAARHWTLAASTPEGAPMDNPAGRRGFSSAEILRREDGSFVVTAAPSARAGNWLPLTGKGGFVLTLRLYESPLASALGDLAKTTLPSLTSLGCAS